MLFEVHIPVSFLTDFNDSYVKIARKSDEKVLYTITLSLGNFMT